MASLNKAILIGRLTADPELKKTPSGASVVSFNLAVDRSYQKEGEQKTDFIAIVAWRNTAEFICKYFKKGAQILIEGEIQTRTWEEKSGGKRYATEVIASKAGFMDSKGAAKSDDAPTANTSSPAPAFEEVPGDEGLPF